MLDTLKKLFQGEQGSPRQSDQVTDEKVACAAILLEVAESDDSFPESEKKMVSTLLGNHFNLTPQQVDQLLAETTTAREKSVDLWPFTHAISKSYTPEQKQDVLRMVWQVIFADGRLDPYEEMLTRRLQTMLSVNHSLVVNAKQEARRAGP
ncbi:MAG: TerB family tellurite resistance protein [Deltaproteobacteria bacterium]|nr:TerB family tellurite resistance protein [Deltaproteobacteria bacterium]